MSLLKDKQQETESKWDVQVREKKRRKIYIVAMIDNDFVAHSNVYRVCTVNRYMCQNRMDDWTCVLYSLHE